MALTVVNQLDTKLGRGIVKIFYSVRKNYSRDGLLRIHDLWIVAMAIDAFIWRFLINDNGFVGD